MSANFIPNYVQPASGGGLFRYWCQKVLPAVYDDSLSYYELLCKVVSHLNNLVKTVDTNVNNIAELNKVYLQLQDYVNSYFDTLDVTNAINAKLDELVADGTMSSLINEFGYKVFNVKAYGAKGNNLDDDTEAFKACANAVNANGGIFYVPTGLYVISEAINFTHNAVTLMGDAQNGSYIKQMSNTDAVVFNNGDNIISGNSVRDISIIYGGSVTSTGVGLRLRKLVNAYFENVIVHGFLIGYEVDWVGNAEFNHCGCVVSVANGVGFHCGNKSVSTCYISCYAGCQDDAVDNGIGFFANNNNIADMTLKYFDTANGQIGIYFDGALSPDDFPPSDINLFGCVFDGQRHSCIRLTNINERGSVNVIGGWFNPLANGTSACVTFVSAHNININNAVMQQLSNAPAVISGVVGGPAVNLNVSNCQFIHCKNPVSIASIAGVKVNNNDITTYDDSAVESFGMYVSGCTEVMTCNNTIKGKWIRGISHDGTCNNSIATSNLVKGCTEGVVVESVNKIVDNNLIIE